MNAVVIPELNVTNLEMSLLFYVGVLGFTVRYSRPEETFAFLDIGNGSLMLEQADGPGRRFTTAPLARPFGRGINFQIEVPNVDELYLKCRRAKAPILVSLEEKWYRREQEECGNRQFVVADPDGYLLRFATDLGCRPCEI